MAACFRWDRCAGREIRVLMIDFGILKGIGECLPRFEAESGIRVRLELLPAAAYWERLAEAEAGKAAVPDVYLQELDGTSYLAYRRGWARNLQFWLGSREWTAEDYDWADLFPNLRAGAYAGLEGDGELMGIPLAFESYMLFYNKALLAAYLGSKLPGNMPALLEAAKAIRQAGRHDGIVLRGARRAANIDVVLALIFNSWADEWPRVADGFREQAEARLTLSRDWRWRRGLEWYAALLKCGPTHFRELNCVGARNHFMAGKAAFMIDASLMAVEFENPSQSEIAGNTGYLPLPAAVEGGRSRTGHWMLGLGIPNRAASPDAGWLLIQWLTHPRQAAALARDHGGPVRRSSWLDPAFRRNLPTDFVDQMPELLRDSHATSVFDPAWPTDAEAVLGVIEEMTRR